MIFTTRPTLSGLALAATIGLGGMALFAPEVEATATSDQAMQLDVVLEGEVDAQGFPARGTPCVIEGHVLPGRHAGRGQRALRRAGRRLAAVPRAGDRQVDLQLDGAQGLELADEGVPFERAVDGGTGGSKGLAGQMTRTMVGGGFNTSFRLAGPHMR